MNVSETMVWTFNKLRRQALIFNNSIRGVWLLDNYSNHWGLESVR